MDEANRKVRFHQISNYQESSIRDYVMSLDIVNKNVKMGHIHHQQQQQNSPRLLNNNSSSSSSSSYTKLTTIEPTKSTSFANSLIFGDESSIMGGGGGGDNGLEKRSAPKLSHRKSNTHNNMASVSTKVIEKGSVVGVECCDVKISYWFREDAFQNLFFQTLMLILCISRWLITRAELNLNQRSLILVISVATAADTLDFFGYLSMQMVYSSWHLLYSVLLIVSLSLVQFVFLHVEDDCLVSSSSHAFSSGNHTAPTKTGNSMENDGECGGVGNGSGDGMMINDEDACKNDKLGRSDGKKKQARFSIFNRQYEFLKRHLKAEENLKKFANNGTQ